MTPDGTSGAPPRPAPDTPRLLLDRARLEANVARLHARCQALGVAFRPHFKTAKSAEVALISTGGAPGPQTVSTIKEAEFLAAAGAARDILLAATAIPARIPRAEALRRAHGTRLILVLDSPEMAALLDAAATEPHEVLVEVDSGEHRAGVPPERALAIARATAATRHLRLAGVMTHGGHSYGFAGAEEIAEVAEAERAGTVAAAEAIRAAGLRADIVSVGSSPTLLHARHLTGVTEARAGVSLLWDLAQMSRGLCGWEDLACSVLSTVIGHNRAGPALVLDAGALALSKDVTANSFAPGTGFGILADEHGHRLPLHVATAYQEHGMVPVPHESWFVRLPVGSLVRVYPNHVCMTAAGGYGAFDVINPDGAVTDRWPRVDGWH
ncbi:alanine racemase [Roseomonas sp. CCTCC AB2023176]|uniref:alanine racemase n=1 Tax=Roseomonas sp. CCTCC AB2023176 TaxID=3342640 RepID=UPI0035DFF87F